jgi:hypothetical protein
MNTKFLEEFEQEVINRLRDAPPEELDDDFSFPLEGQTPPPYQWRSDFIAFLKKKLAEAFEKGFEAGRTQIEAVDDYDED